MIIEITVHNRSYIKFKLLIPESRLSVVPENEPQNIMYSNYRLTYCSYSFTA